MTEFSSLPDDQRDRIQAAAFRRLLNHLDGRKDVQNIDLMILSGFCRNCLADWLADAAGSEGLDMDRDAAREAIYGEPFGDWKAKHQKPASEKQVAAFNALQRDH